MLQRIEKLFSEESSNLVMMICTRTASSTVGQWPARPQPVACLRPQVSYICCLLLLGISRPMKPDIRLLSRRRCGRRSIAARSAAPFRAVCSSCTDAMPSHSVVLRVRANVHACFRASASASARVPFCCGARSIVVVVSAAMAAHADANLQVEAGGASFPLVRTFWTGDAQRNLGAAVGAACRGCSTC